MASTRQKSRGAEGFLSPVLRWALLLGVAVHLAGFFAFRVTTEDLPKNEAGRPFVVFVTPEMIADDAALEERAVLLDSAPLFIPTRWNVGYDPRPGVADPAPTRFDEFEPTIDLVAALRPEGLGELETLGVEVPADLLQDRFWQLFSMFGQYSRGRAVEAAASPAGGRATVEIIESAVHSPGLWAAALPVEGDGTFGSVEGLVPPVFYLRISGAGAVGGAALGRSSGDAAFDAAARAWLQRPATLAGLPEGYLAITVYPAN